MVSPELLLLALIGARLTPLQLDVMLDLVLLERSLSEIAAEHGVSTQRIGRVAKTARAKLAGARLLEELAA